MTLDKITEPGLYIVKSQLSGIIRVVLANLKAQLWFCDGIYHQITDAESAAFFDVLKLVNFEDITREVHNGGLGEFLLSVTSSENN